MGRWSQQDVQEYRLEAPDHPYGMSCDANGPALGPIRLLAKTANSFEPRPIDELQNIFDATFAHPFDYSGLLKGLRTVAGALNDGDLARAMMATLLLRLPPLNEEEAIRARNAVAMVKAAVDDPKHPGWPKGAPDSRGGQFRPKNVEVSEEAVQEAKRRLARLAARRLIREALRRLLSWRRLLRLGAEAASNAVPGLDVVGDAAMAVDIAEMAEEFEELRAEAEIAEEFANKGTYTLEQLRPAGSTGDEEFPSFAALKKIDLIKVFGPAPKYFEYHHIVEQNSEGDIPVTEINSTKNVVVIPKLFHEEVTSEYTRIPEDSAERVSLRESLQGKSLGEKREAGLEALRRVGILH